MLWDKQQYTNFWTISATFFIWVNIHDLFLHFFLFFSLLCIVSGLNNVPIYVRDKTSGLTQKIENALDRLEEEIFRYEHLQNGKWKQLFIESYNTLCTILLPSRTSRGINLFKKIFYIIRALSMWCHMNYYVRRKWLILSFVKKSSSLAFFTKSSNRAHTYPLDASSSF